MKFVKPIVVDEGPEYIPDPFYVPETAIDILHVSRGVLINNVIDGQGSMPTAPVFSDLADGDSNLDSISFDPENASRFDKFDGLEYASRRMEQEMEDKHNNKS